MESWPKHLKSKASAFLVSGFGIGNIIAAYFMPSFAEAYGWRAAFFCRFATRSLVIYIRRGPESKEWEEAKLSGPGKHSQSARSVFSLSMKGLFNRAQFPLTLCVFIVLFSIFGANWPIFGLLPTYLAGEGFDTGVVSNLMTAAAFGTVLGNIVWGAVRR